MSRDASDDATATRRSSAEPPASGTSANMAHSKMPTAAMAFPVVSLISSVLLRTVDQTRPLTSDWLSMVVVVVATIVLIGTAIAACHHAEVIATRLGEPLGTLVLTAR